MAEDDDFVLKPELVKDLNQRLRVNALKPKGPSPQSTDEFIKSRYKDERDKLLK